jgi:putative hydrolase of the HAD superfamily
VIRACLVDVYDTILTADFRARMAALTSFAGVDLGTWLEEWLKTGDDRGRGRLSMAGSFAVTLRACGLEPEPALVGELVRMEARLLREGARLYEDTVPFLGKLRSRGILIALVSNCSQNTRQMLEHLGVIPLADSVILSCEAGSLKPSAEIYLGALKALGVAPADAVMIDDQAGFCAGAEAVGIRAIQIARPDLGKQAAESGFPVVRSLLDVTALL